MKPIVLANFFQGSFGGFIGSTIAEAFKGFPAGWVETAIALGLAVGLTMAYKTAHP